MTNDEKFERLKKFLKDNNVPFKEKVVKKGQFLDLFISKYLICVRLSDENDQKFFQQVKTHYHPLFIRNNETADFVIEKMQNLIIDRMKCLQRKTLRRK